jgi:hypothetical protein
MVERRFSHRFLGIWNGCVKGFQPFHQLIAMAARSSARHELIWCSSPLHGLFSPGSSMPPLLSAGRGAYVQCHAERATPEGENNNPASIAFAAERNSGMLTAIW